jgi:hypothetical protein
MRHLIRWTMLCVVATVFAAQSFAQCTTMTTVPANGATVQRDESGTVDLSWSFVNDRQGYDVYFGQAGQGGCSTVRSTETGQTWSPPANELTPGVTYEWKVIALGTGCGTAPTTGCKTFTIAGCPAAPSLSAPAADAQVPFGSVTLQWNASPNASAYDVYIGIDNDTPSLHATQTSTTKTIFVEPGRTITWFVKAKSNGCTPVASAARSFTTTCPAGAPTLIGPGDGTSVPAGTQINFSWQPFAGSAGYDLEIFDGENWSLVAENLTGTSHSATLPQGDYLWKVRANFDGDCGPAYSEPRELVVGANCTGGVAVNLTSPARGATLTAPVRFEWTAAPAIAQGYQLWVHEQGQRLPRLLTETENTFYETGDIVPGSYEWWVITEYDNCPDAESNHRLFTLTGEDNCPRAPGTATLVSPANGANNLSSPVTFQWNAVPDATGYRVLAYFESEPTVLGTTTSTSLTVGVPAGSGFWAVQTLFGDDCPTTIGDRRAFTVTTGTPCSDTPPQLVTPANNATVTTSQVTFSWNAVTGATHYRLFVATGDEDFDFYGETTATSIQRFVPATGVVRWFVIAGFAVCDDLRSPTQTFTVATEANCPAATITLIAPAPGATATSPVRFAWSAVPNAVAYRIWISIDGQAPVNIARTTATEASIGLPAGTMSWYVEALRERCDPVVSERAAFTINEAANCAIRTAPALLAPIGPAAAPPAVDEHVTFAWTAVDGAIGYRLWVGRQGQGFGDVALTRNTSFELDLEPGLYGWYVQALFEGCNPIASAPSFFRVVESEPRCPGVAPTPIAPAQNSTSTSPVTFSWTAVPNAKKYRVFGAVQGGEPQLLGTTDGTELTRALPPGTFFWSVEASFEACPSTFSPRVRFTVPQAQNCSTDGAELVAPAHGATNVAPPVDFIWSPVSGAVKYVLIARVNDGAPTAFASTTDTHFVVERVPPGRIEWWVVTYFAGCEPVESDHFSFTVARNENCTNRKPILYVPDGDVTSPVHFQWSRVPGATLYRIWVPQGSPVMIATSTIPEAEVELPVGRYEYFVEALFENCPSTESARGEFRVLPPVACGTPETPVAQVVGQALSGTEYRVRWTRLPNVQLYEVQESTSPDFTNAQTFTTSSTSMKFVHEVTGAPVQYFYRVRGVSDCSDARGAYSDRVGVFVTAPRSNNSSAEIGTESSIVQKLFLPGSTEPLNFVATADKPWLTVTPSSGALPAEGITLTVTADQNALALGTNTGTIKVEYSSPNAGNTRTNATTVVNIPTSVSLVTPVLPSGKGTPPPDALIFPGVGHAQGQNDSLFESDIRITNLTAKTQKYELKYTPSGMNGTEVGSSSNVEIAPDQTLALDDVVASMFGEGTNGSALGVLEVRPLESTSETSGALFSSVSESAIKVLETAASSRTYNFTPNGTFGQFVPAVRFDQFVGKASPGELPKILSLQQVSQSDAFRANFGFVEAAGEPADLMVRVYDTASNLLSTIPVSLQPGEHKQLNLMLAVNGINDLQDGRVEVEVVNGNGKITTYVSEVDNKTNDPLMVSPIVKGAVTADRYVVPGMAFLTGSNALWVSDLRIFNGGTTETPATLTFYPTQNPGGAVSKQITLAPGEIEVLDNVVGGLFELPQGAGGMIAITTPQLSSLTATARTYNQTGNGTYGQYIPGVTVAESIGVNDRALQLLQLESSSRFRTNIALSETSGQPVTVDVSVNVPDAKSTPVVTIPLAANEFRTFSLADFGLGAVYNARVSVKVVGGSGKVTASASAIDHLTQDPTYVPAQ